MKGFPVSVQLIIFSHLSDVQDHASNPENRNKINFVKHLMQKYTDLQTRVHPEDEWEEFKKAYPRFFPEG